MQNFVLASLCSRTDLVSNPEDRFSRVMALMYLIPYLTKQKEGVSTPSVWNVIIDHVDLD